LRRPDRRASESALKAQDLSAFDVLHFAVHALADEKSPYNKVSLYVKYDRLIPKLTNLVDDGEVDMATALRAQDAASVTATRPPSRPTPSPTGGTAKATPPMLARAIS